ncbi:MAG: hypothetical protein WAK36_13420, partial [Pseudolabrys sp.]
MARPGRPERNRAARSFRQLRRFHHVINSDKVFGTHNDAAALSAGGYTLAYVVGELDDGAAFIDRALALNPNLAAAWYHSGVARNWLGEPDSA